MKLKSGKHRRVGDQRRGPNPKAHLASHTVESFSSNPVTLLNEFSNYLHDKHGQGIVQEREQGHDTPTALLSKFAGFLANANVANSENSQGILSAFMTALEISSTPDLWVVDSSASDHITNKLETLCDFHPISSVVSIANGQNVQIKGKGKIKLVSSSIDSDALYAPSFPF